MLDWSYNLLPEFERMVLRRLSVFVGRFSLEAVRHVAAENDVDAIRVMDAIDSLVAKSLAAAETGQAAVRYRLLESARVYAAEKLRGSGEADSTSHRHVVYLTNCLERRQGNFAASSSPETPSSHIDNLGNLRACLDWSFSPSGNATAGIRLCAVGAPLLLDLSLLGECRHWTEKALSVLERSVATSKQEMVLQETLAISIMFASGNSTAVRAAIERGLVLARQLGDHAYELQLLSGLNVYETRTGDFHASLCTAERTAAVSKSLGTAPSLAMAEWMLGLAHHFIGNQMRALQHFETGVGLIEGAPQASTFAFGYDHHVRARAGLARSLWLRGQADRALAQAWEAVREGEKLGHTVSHCIALVYAIPVFIWRGDLDTAEELIEKLIGHASTHMLAPHLAVAKGLQGELLIKCGEPARGIVLIKECIKALRPYRHRVLSSTQIAALAEGQAADGRLAEALATIRSMASIDEEMFNSPEIFRIQGEILAAMPQADLVQAEDSLWRALACARRQHAIAWELRATTTLAELLARQERQHEAERLLGDVMGRIGEGFDTVDYIAAARLLADLTRH